MGVMLLIMGISEFREQRRIVAIFALLAAGLVFLWQSILFKTAFSERIILK